MCPQAEGTYIVQSNSDPAWAIGLLTVEPDSPMYADLRIRYEASLASHKPVVHDATVESPRERPGTSVRYSVVCGEGLLDVKDRVQKRCRFSSATGTAASWIPVEGVSDYLRAA